MIRRPGSPSSPNCIHPATFCHEGGHSMMEHKAFLFAYDSFNAELRPVLEHALRSRDYGPLVSFISDNLADLRDPYEGRPLGADWEAMIETHDAHQYGDFSLTKYYDP